jgi:CHASE2 domain-containing sensor protein
VARRELPGDKSAPRLRRAVYGLKIVGIGIAIILLFGVGIVFFTAAWARIGLISAIVVICVPLLIYGWYVDRKSRREREGLEDI